MMPIQPLASSTGSGEAQVQQHSARNAKAFQRALRAYQQQQLDEPSETPTEVPAKNRWLRATMTLPGGVNVVYERTVGETTQQTVLSLAVTRTIDGPIGGHQGNVVPLPRHVDIIV